MKAIVLRAFGSADNFVMAELPIPDVGKGEVRIRVKAVSFNPVDFQIRKGQPEGTRARSMTGTVPPQRVDRFPVGQHLCASGS